MFAAPRSVILQLATACNLNCTYCYLPFRREHLTMSAPVAQAVAASVRPWTGSGPVEVCWHGGEPLTLGPKRFGLLLDCFAGLDVRHVVQTNATLITDAWCDLFEAYGVSVGVSVDGFAADTAARVDLQGRPAYARIMRGIAWLRERGHPLSIIAVVSDPTPERARRLYDFAVEVGCVALGVNIEETEGVNQASNAHDFTTVTAFWTALAEAWQANPVVQVRELERALGFAGSVLQWPERPPAPRLDPLPTMAYDGSVTLISPELAGFDSPKHGRLSCGNVLDTSLDELIQTGLSSVWVREFLDGVTACQASCPYFAFCGGAHPANRYFEHGRFDTTETNYCRNSKIALVEGVLHHADTCRDADPSHPRV
ncbi:radical SAM protein [Amycolatopsis acidiphila]|uniref:Radical SAM protein n=1 Tax=Amycolatopsis acidiphila TaxID=715473 RepID=A0A558A8Y4_9PSEU|nr:cyclophane-forming radical SAM peptide maturase AmcB [Amycolatopsis acidiphila]TVT20718.1 radical SAM protein [Amycolatopsis acidiphila]UIJ59019.1 radical SAM protein [Amycolatopsis acidiphila]GHG73388.1 radical SAM protein [Amycolatopsis acidiphila]